MNHHPFLDQLSPGQSLTSSSPPGLVPWYKLSAHDTSIDELDPADPRLDLLSAASTPLHTSKGIMFTSPMKRLDNLHLSQIDKHLSSSRECQLQADDFGEDSDGSNFDAGNQTIAGSLCSSSDETTDVLAVSSGPKFMRKRKLAESPLAMDLMSSFNPADTTIPHNTTDEMSGICGNETTDSIFKGSFSASDSTPCPIPRKRMKVKSASVEHTPSQPSRLSKLVLDLSGSRKVSASNAPLLSKLNDATDDQSHHDTSIDSFTSTQFALLRGAINSTPISLSTPANSRPASPESYKEVSDEEVNGYKFVKPSSRFKYQTPQQQCTSNAASSVHSARSYTTAFHSNKLDEFSAGKYKIVGDFPVSAAGLMDENDTSVHFADKRINDPYLGPSNDTSDAEVLMETYMFSADKLPLHAHFERDLSNHEMNVLISDGLSVVLFYDYILQGQDKVAFLKKERLRWHPDKWVTRIEHSIFEKSNIDNLSQVINKIISELCY